MRRTRTSRSPWPSNQWRPHGSLRLIDVQFLDTPFLGVRQMTWHLRSCRDRGPSGAAQARKRPQGERKAHTSAYAPYGSDADPPEAQHQPANEGTQDLPPIWLARPACGPAKSGLVCGHHLSADASRRSAWPRTGGGSCLALPGGDHGLAHPHGPGVADLEHRAMVRHWSEDHGEGTPTSASRR